MKYWFQTIRKYNVSNNKVYMCYFQILDKKLWATKLFHDNRSTSKSKDETSINTSDDESNINSPSEKTWQSKQSEICFQDNTIHLPKECEELPTFNVSKFEEHLKDDKRWWCFQGHI